MTHQLGAELAEQAQCFADDLALGWAVNPDDAMRFGENLLVAGNDGPNVVALAAVSPGSRWADVEPLVREALKEIGVAVPEKGVAGWALVRYLATQLQRGGPQAYQRAAALWGMWWELGTPPEIAALVQVMDAWEEAAQAERPSIELELKALAGPIIALADKTLGSGRQGAKRDDPEQPGPAPDTNTIGRWVLLLDRWSRFDCSAETPREPGDPLTSVHTPPGQWGPHRPAQSRSGRKMNNEPRTERLHKERQSRVVLAVCSSR